MPPVPPQPAPVRVRVERGTAIEIPLRVYGDPGGAVTFEIRRQPEHGRTSKPRQEGKGSAVVAYQQSDDGTHASDSFSYVAKSSVGVSAPAEVAIRIVDPDPVFVIPEEIDFGEVTIGEPAAREFTIENRGGGRLAGRMEISGPWKIEPVLDYTLGPKEKQEFQVVFRGNTEREFRGGIRFSNPRGREIELRTVARPPVRVLTPVVELRFDPKTRKRSGTMQLEAVGDQPRQVRIETGERLKAPGELELSPDGKEALTIEAAPGDMDAIDEKLLVVTGRYMAEVAVRSPHVGAILRADESVSFGEMRIEDGAKAVVNVENAGGTRAFVRATIKPPFQIADDESAFALEPGEKRAVPVTIAPAEAGNFRTTLSLKTETEELLVPVEAQVTGKAATKVAERKPSQTNATLAPATEAAQPAQEPAFSPNVPPVKKLQLSRLGSRSCEITWETPADGLRYHLETRRLALGDDGAVKYLWSPAQHAKISVRGGEARARVKRLKPGAFYTFRVASVNPAGEFSAPSPALDIQALQAGPLITPIRVLVTLLVLLVGSIVWQRWAMRAEQKRLEAEIEQQSRTTSNFLDI